MRILVVDLAGCSGRHRTSESHSIGIRGLAVEPLCGPGNIRKRDAVLRVRVELCLICDDQPLTRTDRRRGRQHDERKLALWSTVIGQRVICARKQRALSVHGADAI